MTNRMAEVKDSPQIAFSFVIHDDVCLDCRAPRNEPFDGIGIALQKHGAVSFEVVEQFCISNDAVLERFIKTARVFAFRQLF